MSFRQKTAARPRTNHATLTFEHSDGSKDVLHIIRATYADRQAVIDAAIRAGELDPETNEPRNAAGAMTLAARTLARLLYQDGKRVYNDSPADLVALMELDTFEEWAPIASAALVGEDPADSKKPSAPQEEPSVD